MQKEIFCFDNFVGKQDGWIIEDKKMIAWRTSDNFHISIHEEDVEKVFKDIISKYSQKSIYLILVNNHKIFLANLIRFLLVKEIIRIEDCSEIRLKERLWTRSWWRGESFHTDFLKKWARKKRIKVTLGKGRFFLKPFRNVIIFLWHFRRFLQQLCKMQTHQVFWELKDNSYNEEQKGGREALWVVPGTTAFNIFKAFLGSNLAKIFGISKISVTEWHNLNKKDYESLDLKKETLFFNYFWILSDIVLSIIKDVFYLTKEKERIFNNNPEDIIYYMYPVWYSKAIDRVEESRWKIIFEKVFLSKNYKNIIVFTTHATSPKVLALSELKKRYGFIYIYIQHGTNWSFYFPINFDAFCVLTKEDSDYLNRIGIKQSKIKILGLWSISNLKTNNIDITTPKPQKKIMFIAPYPAKEVFTSAYILTYIEILAYLSEKYRWELVVRPHPGGDVEGIRNISSRFPNARIMETNLSLMDQLIRESPLIVATFYSTSVLEVGLAGVLPISIQVGLEEIVSQIRFPYEKLSVVIERKDDIEPLLVRLMNDNSFRQNRLQEIKTELKKIIVENSKWEESLAQLLKTLLDKIEV